MTERYRLDLAHLSLSPGLGDVILEDVMGSTGTLPGAVLDWHQVLNEGQGSPIALEFELPVDHTLVTPDNFKCGAREIHLYRNDELVWGGKLWVAQVNRERVRFIANSWWFDLLDKRKIVAPAGGPDYAVKKNAMAIVREIIDATQSLTGGDLGITHYNLSESGPDRQIIVCAEERKTVGELIQDLSSGINGFDFEISPDKVFRMWQPRRGVVTTVTFNDTNLHEFSYEVDGTQIVNSVGVTGTSEDCNRPSLAVSQDSASITELGLLEGDADAASDIVDQFLLEEIADEHLRNHKTPLLQPSFTTQTPLQDMIIDNVEWDEIKVGDTVRVETTSGVLSVINGFHDMGANFRVLEKHFRVSQMGYEEIEYTVDSVVEEAES